MAGFGAAIWFTSTRDFDPEYKPAWVDPNYKVPNIGRNTIRIQQSALVQNQVRSMTTVPGTGALTVSGSATADIIGTNFTSNTALIGGAVSFATDVRGSVTTSNFTLNVAASRGAAIALTERVTAEVSDSVFIKNSATSGAAVTLHPTPHTLHPTPTQTRGKHSASNWGVTCCM